MTGKRWRPAAVRGHGRRSRGAAGATCGAPRARLAWRAGLVRLLGLGLSGLIALHGAARAQPLPSLAELEAAGARIGQIRIVTGEVFDMANPKEDVWLFRLANALRVKTRPGVIERALLFKSGDVVSVQAIEESERLLRSNRYIFDAQFRPRAYHDGVVDIDVITRDSWTLDAGINVGRSGGTTTSDIRFIDYNLLGSGITAGFSRSRDVDRTSSEYQLANDRVLGTWVSLAYSHADNSDGHRDAASVVRPFHALDARWAAGLTASDDSRIESVYGGGNIVSQYRHRLQHSEAFGGWSAGLVDGWVQRYTLGLNVRDHAYAAEPGRVAPPGLPVDERLVTPFVRYQLIEDRFEKELNRNLIGRPEFFALGLAATAQLGRASTGLGSSRDAWLFSASLSRGFEPAPSQTLTTAAALSGQRSDGQWRRLRTGAQAQYYVPQGPHWLFFASVRAEMLTRPDPADLLALGGDEGLRGYPLRYQNGTRRTLFVAEERFYTDIYLWQLFRIGGAAFVDVGRAWHGGQVAQPDSGWLADGGIGLRIVSVRSALSNVLHLDLAFPVNPGTGVKSRQFLVKSRTSF